MQYELLPEGAFGANFQGATCIQGLKGNRTSIRKGTEVCQLTATDLHEPAFEWNRFPEGRVPIGIENLPWLDEFNGTVAETSFRDSRLHLNFFAGVSTLFLCALCTAFGRTCPLMHSLLRGRPLRGFDQRSKLIQWILLGYVLLVAIQVVTCQILVSGGVHIQPDYLSVIIRVQAELAFLLLFVRLGLKWRCDSIGPCRSVCNSRKCAIRPKPQSIKLKAILMCLNIASSHATQVSHACEQGAMFAGNRSSVHAVNDSDGQYHRDNSVLCDPLQSIQQYPDSLRASAWSPIEQRTDLGQHSIDALTGHAAGGSALPEATFCEYETSPFSWPCEGDSRTIVPDGTEEGHSHSSMNGPDHDSDIESSYSVTHGDDRLTFLGNFVIDPRTQEPLGTDVGRDRSVRRKEAENLVFQDRPFLAKTWFAPLNRCNSQPRDLVVSVEDFGRIGEVVCSVWGDYLTASSCSFRLVWPQPALYTYQESWHFLVFDGQGPPALLVHNTCGSDQGEQSQCHSFCACAFDHKHSVRRSQEKSSGKQWKHGDLVKIVTEGARGVCESFPLLFPVNSRQHAKYGDNTATPIDDGQDELAMMQAQQATRTAAEKDAPSVWGTALMQWLEQAELFHHLRVMQGHFGAKSAKPTNLLVAGLPAETTSALEKVSRTSSCPKTSSIGLEDRGWATSSLKEYPRDFCCFLAKMFDRWMSGATRRSGPPPVDVHWLKAMHITEVDQRCKEGPDFNPLLIKNSHQQGAES